MTQEFIHLRTYSAYSLAKGALKIKSTPALCKMHNMPAIAITDTSNLFGALEFAITCQNEGIQPIIGTVLNIYTNTSKTLIGQNRKYFKILLLAQNEIGYKHLLKISSLSFLNTSVPGQPEFPIESLQKYSEGIIALSGGIYGPIGAPLYNNDRQGALHNLKFLQETFPNRFYIEIIRDKNEILVEEASLKLAFDYNIPIVATNHVFFESPDMLEAHDALLCIEQGTFISDNNRTRSDENYYFKSQEEMKALFYDLPEAIKNTIIIAQRCSYIPTVRPPRLPQIQTSTNNTIDDELYNLAVKGLNTRFHEYEIPMSNYPEYLSRLDYEFKVISQMGYSGYFLIVYDFIKYANDHSIAVGPGRGSGAGSLIAWSLKITNVNPIEFNLIFERFLNPERVSMPDFDIDFCQERRDEIIKYVCDKYGEFCVAHIITFGTLQAKAVLRDVGRVLGLPYGLVDKIAKFVPNNTNTQITLQDAINIEPGLVEIMKTDASIRKMINISLKLEGLYRHASIHAAGIVISDRNISDIVPLYKDPKSNIPVTQFNMKMVEKSGLVKFDFLGLKTLTTIQKTCELVNNRGIQLNINKIDLNDPKTFDLINRLETVGVFQLESTGMRNVIKLLKPDRFEDLIALISLYRPGPMDDIPSYVARKHGQEKIRYAHPLVKEILESTYGVMVYQEQVMHIAQVLAGYSMGQADLLRRAMGKKIHTEMVVHRQRFVEGAHKNNMREEDANLLFDQIAKFAGYGFNKSHATPYALIAYQTAYLKAHYPIEFMTATMNLEISNTSKLCSFRQNLNNLNIKLLPPNIQKSQELFSVEKTDDGEFCIRYGLSAIKGTGHNAMQQICEDRKSYGKFKNFSDFITRSNSNIINKKQLEALICAGTFDVFEIERNQLYQNVPDIIKFKNNFNSNQTSLFQENSEKLSLTDYSPWDIFEKLNHEFDVIGFYLSDHPLATYKTQIEKLGVVLYSEIQNLSETDNILLCAIATKIIKKISKNGKQFVFIHLSDTTGIFEVVAFSEIFKKYKQFLEPGKILLINSTIKHDGEMIRINALSISEFDPKKFIDARADTLRDHDAPIHELIIHIKSEEHLNYIYKTLQNYTVGNATIILSVKNKKIKLNQKYKLSKEDLSKLV